MRNPQKERYLRRKIALRRMLLDSDGHLTRDGRTLAFWVRQLCNAGRGQPLILQGPNGVDAVETVARAARREVWDALVEMLNLDAYEIANLQGDD